jgi:pimeloyl-ACP methyl ester carboxylesterase
MATSLATDSPHPTGSNTARLVLSTSTPTITHSSRRHLTTSARLRSRHGLGGSRGTWRHLIADLSRTHTVIAPDLPGHGELDPPAGDYSLGAHACAMRDLLLSWFSLAGHSLGGGIALQTVFPERVDRLILIGSGGLGSEVSLVLRAGTGAGRGLPSRYCRFINGLLILVTAARPGTGRRPHRRQKPGFGDRNARRTADPAHTAAASTGP